MRAAAGLLLTLVAAVPAAALETDQYYAWGRPLRDSGGAIDARVNRGIEEVLAEVNARRGWRTEACPAVAARVGAHFRQFIFHDVEIWAINSPEVDRVPSSTEEAARYRDRWMYRREPAWDTSTWVPPSPTIAVGGIRFGTDKLSHFFSEGDWYYKGYRRLVRRGRTPDESERRVIRRGILAERTILGLASSGTLSFADLEANEAGLGFLRSLCEGDDPGLVRDDRGWRLAHPFRIERWVTPRWDESWNPSVVGRLRWRRVRPVVLEYCPKLDDPRVRDSRARYAALEVPTLTDEIVRSLVREDRLPDPARFDIERLCDRAAVPAVTPP